MVQSYENLDQITVNFKNYKGENLVGTLLNSKQNNAAIVCHGLFDSRKTALIAKLSQALARKGFCVLSFDFSGNGESDGLFDFAAYNGEVEEIRQAVLFLKEQNKSVQALIGHSKGANDVLIYSSKYDDIPFVVNVAGRFDFSHGLKERFGEDIMNQLQHEKKVQVTTKLPNGKDYQFFLTEWGVQERAKISMEKICKNIKVSEVLSIHGSEDKTIPVGDARQIAKHISQHKLVILNGANHMFSDQKHSDQIINEVEKFLLQL